MNEIYLALVELYCPLARRVMYLDLLELRLPCLCIGLD